MRRENRRTKVRRFFHIQRPANYALRLWRAFSAMRMRRGDGLVEQRFLRIARDDRHAALVELPAHPAVDLFLRVIEVRGKNAFLKQKSRASVISGVAAHHRWRQFCPVSAQ
jgi:hypothetical protein